MTQARSPVAKVAMTTSMCKQVQEEQGECYAEKADKAMQETANLALHDLVRGKPWTCEFVNAGRPSETVGLR